MPCKTLLDNYILENNTFEIKIITISLQVYEINTTYITASGQTPFYLMFHRQVRPMDGNFSLQVSEHLRGDIQSLKFVKQIYTFINNMEL